MSKRKFEITNEKNVSNKKMKLDLSKIKLINPIFFNDEEKILDDYEKDIDVELQQIEKHLQSLNSYRFTRKNKTYLLKMFTTFYSQLFRLKDNLEEKMRKISEKNNDFYLQNASKICKVMLSHTQTPVGRFVQECVPKFKLVVENKFREFAEIIRSEKIENNYFYSNLKKYSQEILKNY